MTTTTVTLARLDRDNADKLVTTLRAAMAASYLYPEIGAAPMGGEFEVFVTTSYEFVDPDNDNAPVGDQQKALMDHLLMVLAYEAVR